MYSSINSFIQCDSFKYKGGGIKRQQNKRDSYFPPPRPFLCPFTGAMREAEGLEVCFLDCKEIH